MSDPQRSEFPRLPPPRTVRLRQTKAADIPALFQQQLDPVACGMAMVHPRGREEFEAHWTRLLTAPPPRLVARVVEADGVVAGTINCFQRDGIDAEVAATLKAGGAGRGASGKELDFIGYWVGREHWGRGIATRALAALLEEVRSRPLHARAARSNAASLRVLERCGFVAFGSHQSAADARFVACEEVLMVLR